MKYLVLSVCLIVVLGMTASRPATRIRNITAAGTETAKLQVVDASGTEAEYTIELPSGPPATGDSSSQKAIDKQITNSLAAKNIACPPKREKVTDYVWRCGNGTLVKTSNAKLARWLAKAWG